MSGFAVIHRTLLGHSAFRNDAEAMAFAWMVVKASWKPVRVRYKDRQIALERGQLSISQRDMAAALDRDKAWVERLWRRLKAEAMIEVGSEAGVAVITICNYDKFQDIRGSGEAVNEAPDEAAREAVVRQARGTEQQDKPDNQEQGSEAKASSPARGAGDRDDDDLFGGKPPAAPREPIAQAVEIWNATAVDKGWPTITALADTRRSAIKARLKVAGLEGWRAAITRAAMSPYLGGSPPPRWFTFDWVIKQANFQKLIEGNYDRTDAQPGTANRTGATGIGRTAAAADRAVARFERFHEASG